MSYWGIQRKYGGCIGRLAIGLEYDPASLAFEEAVLSEDEVTRLRALIDNAPPMPDPLPAVPPDGDVKNLLVQ